MKKNLILSVSLISSILCYSQTTNEVEELKSDISSLTTKQIITNNEVASLKKENQAKLLQINNLSNELKKVIDKETELNKSIDSLANRVTNLSNALNDESTQLNNNLEVTKTSIEKNRTSLITFSLLGLFILLISIICFACYLFNRRKNTSTTMAEVRKAQEALQNAQMKMQEDSVKLDNQMITLIEKQISSQPASAATATSSDTDHSLALKVADEIVRIEMNLSHMDSSVKGYKQLSKAVERIRNNFQANGYEIVEMLGKPYNEGMKVVANFVPDENLNEGEQIITGITKPQINYNGKMIQSAQITVSQNI